MTESHTRVRQETVDEEALQSWIVLKGRLEHELDAGKFLSQRGDHLRNVLFDMHPVVEKILHDHDPRAAPHDKDAHLIGQFGVGLNGHQDVLGHSVFGFQVVDILHFSVIYLTWT